ncbi:MAG: hypothetical protein Q8M94_10485 [Ignavibacteria bacterium]|nr:hypothetical protein [Ignavibacteria bacterium]
MNILKYFLFLPILIVFYSCHSDLLTKKYEATILKNAISFSIPQFQNNEEIELIKKNKIKSVSYIAHIVSRNEIDSLTFIEYDLDGRILRRTTKENTTQGCLPYMMRQEFTYEGDRIKKVTDYTFKYVANSTLENWLLRDTTKLLMFDWEDYTYSGDTIIVETGFSTTKFIKDTTGNIIKRTLRAKTNNQILDNDYDYSNSVIHTQMTNQADVENHVVNYEINKNVFNEAWEINDKKYQEELIFDATGLLKKRIRYLNGEETSKTIVTYSYY